MSKFFEESEEKQYIPPDYGSPPDDDPDSDSDNDVDEIDDDVSEDEDEGQTEAIIDKLEEEKKVVTSTSPTFGSSQPQQSTPWGTAPSFGGGSSTPSSPFGGGSTPWNSGKSSIWNSPGSTWNSGQNNTQKEKINRDKKVIFCDFLDCIVETWDSQGRPGYLPRDIYDLKARFEVWSKIQAFNPEIVYSLIPINLIPNTNGTEGWIKTLEYFCSCLSAYLRVPYTNCKILAQTTIGQPKEELINSILSQGINRSDAIYIGIYSGLAGQSNRDQLAAQNCNIDYIDLGILLNNMY